MKLLDYIVSIHCPITTNCLITLSDYNFASKLEENTEVYEAITFEESVIVLKFSLVTINRESIL